MPRKGAAELGVTQVGFPNNGRARHNQLEIERRGVLRPSERLFAARHYVACGIDPDEPVSNLKGRDAETRLQIIARRPFKGGFDGKLAGRDPLFAA